MAYEIDSTGNVGGAWSNGSPPTTPGTLLDATWMNMLQDELLAILAAAGIAPVKGTNNQVIAAIQDLITWQARPAYKVLYASNNDYTSLSTFLAGTYTSVGVVSSSAGELRESRYDYNSGGASMLYSMVVDATASCTCNVISPLYDDTVELYVDGTLEHTWSGAGTTTTPYGMALSAGTHVIQFLNSNDSGDPAATWINDWMTGNPVVWLRAALS